jgi:hypothetical protein
MNPFKAFPYQHILIAMIIFSCASACKTHKAHMTAELNKSVSAQFNHFENGQLFTDVEKGLDILWEASFINNRAYKENVGLLVSSGLIILPNRNNKVDRGSLGMLPLQVREEKLWVYYNYSWFEVKGIVHTHPDPYCLSRPAPGNDYQFARLGVHNFIIDHSNLFDAFHDLNGDETFVRLGPRNAYRKIEPAMVLIKAEHLALQNRE